jgi:hypothetical protein
MKKERARNPVRKLKNRLLALALLGVGIAAAPLPAAKAAMSCLSDCVGECARQEPISYRQCVAFCQFDCRPR